MADIITFRELARIIINLHSKHRQKLISVDGGGGAGKTTFATRLQKEIPGSFILEIDDFYKPPQLRIPVAPTEIINPNMDWDRFRTAVLEAVKSDKEVSYQLYNFDAGTLSGEVICIPPDAIIILEGVWSLREEFVDFYDYRIWLDAPAKLRLERGLLRDGEKMRPVWEQEWIPIDEYYKKIEGPQLKANCIVDISNSDFQNDRITLI